MTLHKPNLFLIGAMKSGTTYLNKLLDAHPSIFMSRPEEPSYFVEPRLLRKLWPYAWDQGFWRSPENYLRLFEPGRNATILGEASTNYTKLPHVPGVPERIRSFAPDARFIYVMRDPVERTISHYWHSVIYEAERRPMLKAIMRDPQYCAVSYYAMQLRPFFEYFGKNRVCVLTYEQLTTAPNETMRRLYRWLEVDPSIDLTPSHVRAENVTPTVVAKATGFGAMHRLRQSRPMRVVMPRVPFALRRLALRAVTSEVRRDSVDTSEVVEFLRPVQRTQTAELRDMLEREFPEWTTLQGGHHR